MKSAERSFLSRTWSTWIAGALVAACAPSGERIGEHRAAIIGADASSEDVGSVQVLIQHATNPTPATSFQCTGTVVSPHVVLTAAHCLDEAIVGPGQSFYVFFGTDSSSDSQLADRKNFGYSASVTAHPDFDAKAGTGGGHDIGVVVLLDRAVLPPRELWRGALDATIVGKELHSLGYGETTAGDVDSSGRRVEGWSSVTELSDEFLVSEPSGHSVCEGDSGGPAFLADADGVERLAGVHSWIEHSKTCTGKNYDTRVDLYRSWIEDQIRAADPGFLPDAEPDPSGDAGDDAPSPSPSAPGSRQESSSSGCNAAGSSWCGFEAYAILLLVTAGASRRRRRLH